MAKTRLRLGLGSALAVTAFIACGQADGGGSGTESGGSNSGGAANSGGTPSSGGTLSSGGLSGGANSSGSGATPTGGSGPGTGGKPSATSGGQAPISGGNPPTAGTGGATAGAVGTGGKPQTGGSGGTASGGSSGVASGGDDNAGAAGLGGAGGASECPAIKCAATSCQDKWLGLDGCPTCACAPPARKLSLGNVSCPSASLTMTAVSGYYVGGYNRWLIDFEWTCSDMSLLGEPSHAHLQVGVVEPITPPIDASNRTFFYPRQPPQPGMLDYELRGATVWVRGSGVPEIELRPTPSSSFLSLRIENGVLVGGVEYIGTDSTSSSTITLAGPFSVAVPKPL